MSGPGDGRPFDYRLPPELIAQSPAEERSRSRLLVVRRSTARLVERRFEDIVGFLSAGDLLVVNNARVLKARLRARKTSGGAVEILLTKPAGGSGAWEAMVRPARRVRTGACLLLELPGSAEPERVEVLAELPRGRRILGFSSPGRAEAVMDAAGELPMPPYVKDPSAVEPGRYQTVYASVPGAVAAPTAGLHFTPALMSRLRDEGVDIAEITLNVGPGTFLPLSDEQLASGRLHSEAYFVSDEAAGRIDRAISEGRRIVAVGTTSLRVLETLGPSGFAAGARSGNTDIFIRPGVEIRVASGLVTNFHLPGTSLLCLVSAFAGTDLMKRAYTLAVKRRFRFYSFGDAMLIID